MALTRYMIEYFSKDHKMVESLEEADIIRIRDHKEMMGNDYPKSEFVNLPSRLKEGYMWTPILSIFQPKNPRDK